MRLTPSRRAAINVLLRELEAFNGIVIFATNLAANFDPAFERRIRTHVLFEMPGVEERERIWQLQIHPKKTPLAADVDFRRLAERYVVSGGDIKNAVIKAAAVMRPGRKPDRNNAPTERFATIATTTIVRLGGMIGPIVQADAVLCLVSGSVLIANADGSAVKRAAWPPGSPPGRIGPSSARRQPASQCQQGGSTCSPRCSAAFRGSSARQGSR